MSDEQRAHAVWMEVVELIDDASDATLEDVILGHLQAVRRDERERVVAWLRGEPWRLTGLAIRIERGDHDETGGVA